MCECVCECISWSIYVHIVYLSLSLSFTGQYMFIIYAFPIIHFIYSIPICMFYDFNFILLIAKCMRIFKQLSISVLVLFLDYITFKQPNLLLCNIARNQYISAGRSNRNKSINLGYNFPGQSTLDAL